MNEEALLSGIVDKMSHVDLSKQENLRQFFIKNSGADESLAKQTCVENLIEQVALTLQASPTFEPYLGLPPNLREFDLRNKQLSSATTLALETVKRLTNQNQLATELTQTGLAIAGILGDTLLGRYFQLQDDGAKSRLEDAFRRLATAEKKIELEFGALSKCFLEKLKPLLQQQNGDPLTKVTLKAHYKQYTSPWSEKNPLGFPSAKNIVELAMISALQEKAPNSDLLTELLQAPSEKGFASKLDELGKKLELYGKAKSLLIGGGYVVAAMCMFASFLCHVTAYFMALGGHHPGGADVYLHRAAGSLSETAVILGHPFRKGWNRFRLSSEQLDNIDITAYIATGFKHGKEKYENLTIEDRLKQCIEVSARFQKDKFEPVKGLSALETEYASHEFVRQETSSLEALKKAIAEGAKTIKDTKVDAATLLQKMTAVKQGTGNISALSDAELYVYAEEGTNLLTKRPALIPTNIKFDIKNLEAAIKLEEHFLSQKGHAANELFPKTMDIAMRKHLENLAMQVKQTGVSADQVLNALTLKAQTTQDSIAARIQQSSSVTNPNAVNQLNNIAATVALS